MIRSEPDGHTILIAPVGVFAINRFLFKNPGFDPDADLIPITQAASVPNVLIVNPGVKAQTFADFVALARASSGSMNYASMGVATSGHISGELFNALAKTSLTHVPYRGSTPALTDLLGGQVQAMFANLPTALPFIKAGQVRAIAQTGTSRHPQIPEVPTLAELGLDGYDVVTWFGFAVPRGTPAPIIDALEREIVAALRDPESAAKLQDIGLQVIANDRATFKRVIAQEVEKWRGFIELTKVKVE